MKRVLVTGASGFVGRNICPQLESVCNLFTPNRSELNLLDEQAVREYIVNNRIDMVLNLANPNPAKNPLDKPNTMFEDSIRLFLNLYRAQNCYEMMYTIGSGAEYDKSLDAVMVTEEDECRSLPYDSYGLAKYTINQLIATSKKQCNLRMFACYGPTDHESKFITHVIRSCINHQDIIIRQDCYFDYLHVYDFGRIVEFFVNHLPHYRSYNISTGSRVLLSEIADIVKRLMGSSSKIVFLREGLNREYTASNKRLLSEMGNYNFMSLEDGIRMQIESERKVMDLV